MDEFASFSITVWPATSTLTCTLRTRDLVACSRHFATVPCPGRPRAPRTRCTAERGFSGGRSGNRPLRRVRPRAQH
ncbi:hypothetical protein BZL29_5183 [Mycobacterium kansasii]|uniref:Uncharacterized protein n=1 Tax=Mycobacterium kansasii TaxID=1768 RepID=A0A1V3X1C3_MYCKA|nr:hypothetical protein BZL29_5183 [Mycobacterium kansasii]